MTNGHCNQLYVAEATGHSNSIETVKLWQFCFFVLIIERNYPAKWIPLYLFIKIIWKQVQMAASVGKIFWEACFK